MFRVIHMKSNGSITVITALLTSLLLIYNNDLAAKGAIEGMRMCFNTIIPALFPFIFLTNYMISCQIKGNSNLARAVGKLFLIPENCEDLLIPILLGGYPLGVIAVARAYKLRRISKECANRMLLYCNNPGPAFIFGIMGKVFQSRTIPVTLWFIQILCCLTLSSIYPSYESGSSVNIEKSSISKVMNQSLQSASTICGWVILFKILLALLPNFENYRIFSGIKIATIGCIELTNGCLTLASIQNSNLKFIIASVLLGFGGICVMMQSISLMDGLSKKNYYIGKCVNGILAAVYSTVFVISPPKAAFIITAIPTLILKISKRKSRFSGMVRV